MNQLNSVILEGNLTQDPRSQTTAQDRLVCNFAVASNRYYRDRNGEVKSEVSYIDIESWGSIAKQCSSSLSKGTAVKVVGRLKQDRWTDQEQQPRSKIKIVAEHVESPTTAAPDNQEDS